jgi:hypothetical protein
MLLDLTKLKKLKKLKKRIFSKHMQFSVFIFLIASNTTQK